MAHMTVLPLPPFLRKIALASRERMKNKLMQAFQELDSLIQASADCWESPPPHFNVLTGQIQMTNVCSVTRLISACSGYTWLDPITSTPPPGQESSSNSSTGPFLSFSLIYSASMFSSKSSKRCWTVKLGCQGDRGCRFNNCTVV